MTAIVINFIETNRPWADKSPYPVIFGDALLFNCNVAWAASVANDGNLFTKLYKDEKEVTSPALTGSTTATGADNNITGKTLPVTLTPGDYVYVVGGTIDGIVRTAGKILLQVQAQGKEQ